MNKINCLLISFLIILSFSLTASATDWAIGNPTGLGFTNVVSDQFVVAKNNASGAGGLIATYDFSSDGSFTASDIFENCDKCLYGMINPTDNTRWGTDEAGNVFYTTNLAPVDYSAGFFTVSLVTGTCSGIGGNCNNLHRVATLSADTQNRKMTFDSSGNVYITSGTVIYRFIQSLGYSQQTFKDTLADMGGICGVCIQGMIALYIDNQDNVHAISTVYKLAGAGTVHTDKVTYTSTGSLINHTILYTNNGAGQVGINAGGMVIDSVNGTYNFTWSPHYHDVNQVFLYHHVGSDGNSTGSDIGGGALAGITNVSDIGYNNFQIYLSSGPQNLIRSYVTLYQGSTSSQIPSNPDGLTGTFRWVNGYGSSVTTITPGAALAYRWTISNELSNYTFFSGWSTDTQTEPGNLHDLTELSGMTQSVFPTSSNDLAGTSIYGYLLSRRNNDSSWSLLTNPQILTISPAAVGFDSITLDKTFYNLTGDTITATFTYSSTSVLLLYQWEICSRIDCLDGTGFAIQSLASHPSTSSLSTTGIAEGNYYAVMMRHLPFLSNKIVASQRFEVRPPVIGVSWDKTTYNLLPQSQGSTSTCLDSTPSTSYFATISGYGGLQEGFFSCSSFSNTPSPGANANNSIMRGSLFARYNGTFYLNNSLGNIWNGTLNNGSGAIFYYLTNSSVTGTWTLKGINSSTPGSGLYNETVIANAEVDPASQLGYSVSVSPSTAYNGDTLYLTFTKPIYKLLDYVIIKDASGNNIASFKTTDTSGSYYIDPNKQYTYGTWTAYWVFGSENKLFDSSTTVFTFTVKNAGRPQQNGSIIPDTPGEVGSGTAISLLSVFGVIAFWGFVLWLGVIGATIQIMTKHGAGVSSHALMFVGWLAAIFIAIIGLFDPFKIYVIVISTVIAAIMFKFLGRDTTTEG